jgi:hypothetical protein
MAMPKMTLKAGGKSIDVSSARVVRQAERMGKLSTARRAHRLEKAKAAVTSEAGGKKGKKKEALPLRGTKRAAAIVLGQGINEV